jgi:nitroreductase
MDEKLKTAPHRNPGHPVDPLFPGRWSRRAMSGAHVSRENLMTLFEAARWAPSSYNNQPWRFVYALRGTDAFARYHAMLTPRNKSWAGNAGVLIVMASKKTLDLNGKPSITHSFDAGSAWMSLALQADMLGLTAHGMEGFDYGAAAEAVGLPEGYVIEAMCAVGHPGSPEVLPEDLRDKEKPNGRKRVEETVFENRFPKDA